jgi:hypothetical protein
MKNLGKRQKILEKYFSAQKSLGQSRRNWVFLPVPLAKIFFVKVWGQDFSKKSGIKSRRFFLESLGPKKKDSFFWG